MININEVIINGHDLTIEQVVAVSRFNAKVMVSECALEAIEKARALVEKIISGNDVVYGINTGFGDFSKVSIDTNQIEKLQENLIISHAVGTGEPFKQEVVRAMMLLRANALCVGNSGVRPEVVNTLVSMLNNNVHPIVPQKGSLGASGDLAPLSHMVLTMLGRGEANYNGNVLTGAEAMKLAGIKTITLKAKEGLALINGTQAMTAVGTLSYYDAFNAARLADICAAMTMEALTALRNAFDPRVHAVRPHVGQKKVAKNILALTDNSEILQCSQKLRVQDAYAIRCVPQVHGAVRNALNHVREIIEVEINSVTDNPILFPDDGDVISAGNFHGEPMALIFDYLGIAVAELASISERRLERMVNSKLSEGLPAFLAPNGGLNSGFMIIQYSAASLVSENKVLAHPASVDSIPSSANQEDHVSMGTTAARKSAWIVDNTLSVLAFELMAAAQGIDIRGKKPSPICQAVQAIVRNRVAFAPEDREFRIDIEKMNDIVRSGEIQKSVLKMLPDFE